MKRYGKLFDSGYWLDADWWYPEADYDALAALLAQQDKRILEDEAEIDESQARIAQLEAALREAIEYVTLDSEYPLDMVNRWERAFPVETDSKL